jgi:hypothetical protein
LKKTVLYDIKLKDADEPEVIEFFLTSEKWKPAAQNGKKC